MATNRVINTLTLLLGLPICFFGATDRFVGEWKVTSGGGLTKIQIQLSNSQLRLHAFGACHPNNCDWGEVDAQAYAPDVSASVRETAEVISAQFVTSFRGRFCLYTPSARISCGSRSLRSLQIRAAVRHIIGPRS